MEYKVSIRIPLTGRIADLIKKEKDWLVENYASPYKSLPHITLYLGQYPKEGFAKLVENLKELAMGSFSFFLKPAQATLENDRHRYLYSIDVSNKDRLRELHEEIAGIATRYGGSRDGAPYDPHITLGAVDLDKPQPSLEDIQRRTKEIEGQEVTVSQIVALLHERSDGAEHMTQIEEVFIPLP